MANENSNEIVKHPNHELSSTLSTSLKNNINKWPISLLERNLEGYNRSVPEYKLQLEWVYGYKGNDCRSNLYYLESSNTIVYFSAAVGVVHKLECNSKSFFLHHNDDILSLALHPNHIYIATGQKRDLVSKKASISIWNTEKNNEIISLLSGDTDNSGFSSLSFSQDGKCLYSSNLTPKPSLSLWDWESGNLLSESIVGDRILDMKVNPITGNLVSCGVRNIKFWTYKGNFLSSKSGRVRPKGTPLTIFALAFSPHDNQITYSGTSSGDLYVFKNENLFKNISRAHESIILCLVSNDSYLFSGSKDGTVKMRDHKLLEIYKILDFKLTSFGYPDLQLRTLDINSSTSTLIIGTKLCEIFTHDLTSENSKIIEFGHSEGELWGLVCHPFKPLFVTASDDKSLRLWNFDNYSLVSKRIIDFQIRCVDISPDGSLIAFGCINGSLRVVLLSDINTEVATYDNRNRCVNAIKFSPNGLFLVSAYSDSFALIFDVNSNFKLIGTCKGSSSSLTHIDWNNESTIIRVNSSAKEQLYFSISDQCVDRITLSLDDLKDICWASCTAPLSSEVQGIWQKYQVMDDINNIDTNFPYRLIATADDFSMVNLYRYPNFQKGSKSRSYNGHSSHVTNTKFAYNLTTLFSTGGNDQSIFQWKLVKLGETEDLSKYSLESNSSLTGTSDVEFIDSDIEREKSHIFESKSAKVNKYKRFAEKSSNLFARDSDLSKPMSTNILPSSNINLEFVHGYRGYDCRDNLFYLNSDEIVYHVAALGIVYNKKNHSQRFYSHHDDDILCLDIHPNRNIVATGQVGKEPMIHLWDPLTMQTLSILKGVHTSGICALDFSRCGTKLASIGLDLDHTIIIYEWKSGKLLSSALGHKDRIFMIRWNPFIESELITVGSKHIKFWKPTGGSLFGNRGILPKEKKATSFMCITFSYLSPNESSIDPKEYSNFVFAGGLDGCIYIWQNSKFLRFLKAHDGPIYSLLSMPDSILSAGRDSKIIFWDHSLEQKIREILLDRRLFTGSQPLLEHPCIRSLDFDTCLLLGTKNNEIIEVSLDNMSVIIRGHGEGEIWGIDHDSTSNKFATTSDDKTLRVWDRNIHELIFQQQLGFSSRSIAFSNNGKFLVVGLSNGHIIFYNVDGYQKRGEVCHRSTEILILKFSPNDLYLAVASKDREIDIYSTQSESRIGICKGASGSITHFDWDNSSKIIRINTMSREILYYELPKGKRIFISNDNDIQWHTRTCTLGRDCKGVWYKGSDITDINSLDINSHYDIIATADDLGYVRIYSYPCDFINAKHKIFCGHSSHVTSVRWSKDGQSLVSLGGNDTAILVWKVTNQGDKLYEIDSNLTVNSVVTTEDEGGYDSDINWETNINYIEKIYTEPVRDITKSTESSSKNISLYHKSKNQPYSLTVKSFEGNDFDSLLLHYVFGYRGYDSRSNIFFLDNSHIVYHCAALGIVLDLDQNIQTFYNQHNDDIISLSVFNIDDEPLKNTPIATGQIGKDPAIHIWYSFDSQPTSILIGAHEMGVNCLDFSKDGQYLLSIGMENKHSLAIWNWSKGLLLSKVNVSSYKILAAGFISSRACSENNVTLLSILTCGISHLKYWILTGNILTSRSLKFSENKSLETIASFLQYKDDILYVGSLRGYIYVFKNLIFSNEIKIYPGVIWCIKPHNNLIISGSKSSFYDDCVLSYLNPENNSITKLLYHQDVTSVRSMAIFNDRIVIGSRNSIYEFTEHLLKPINIGHSSGELWGLSVHSSKQIALTCSHDETLKIWDLSLKKLIKSIDSLTHAAQCVDISLSSEHIAIGFTNGQLSIYNFSGKEIDINSLKKRRDFPFPIKMVKFSPDNLLIAVAYENSKLIIYNMPFVNKSVLIQNIHGYATNCDWSNDSKFIQLNSLNFERLVFNTKTGSQVEDNTMIRNIVWQNWTCVFGPDIKGIWDEKSVRGNINSAHVANRGHLIATGDDNGVVKLFNYPTISSHSEECIQYFGHSAHVTNVKFTYNDEYMVSTGGDDSCVFIWKTFSAKNSKIEV